MGSERGYSADLWARFWGGRELHAEYATMENDLTGAGFPGTANPTAFMAMADVWKGRGWGLKGYYSAAEPQFNPVYSVLNPYYEYYGWEAGSPHIAWERWLRNPLVIPNVRVIGGMLNWQMLSADWTAQYYHLSDKGRDFWGNTQWSASNGSNVFGVDEVPYDRLWAIGMRKNVADGVDVNLTYARQMANDTLSSSLTDPQLLVLGVAVGF